MYTFCAISELGIRPDINVIPSANVIEGDLLTFSCNVNMTHQRNSKLRISLVHGHTTLGLNMRQEAYNMSAKANDSGQYECIASLGVIHKSSSVNITVNGERCCLSVFQYLFSVKFC